MAMCLNRQEGSVAMCYHRQEGIVAMCLNRQEGIVAMCLNRQEGTVTDNNESPVFAHTRTDNIINDQLLQ